MYSLSILAFVIALRALSWTRIALPTLLFMATPQTVLLTLYGNVTSLAFLAVVLCFALGRRYPLLAGMAGAVAWLKPNLALPFFLLIVLFHVRRRRRGVAGFAAATLCIVTLTLETTGWASMVHWLGSLAAYSHDIASQPNIASLSGLYIAWAPASLRSAFEVLSVATTLGATAFTWRRHRDSGHIPITAVALLWFVWLLATPYAHFGDELFLTIPVLALIGRDGTRVGTRLIAAMLYLLYYSVLLFATASLPVQLFCLPVVAIALCLLKKRISAPHALGVIKLAGRVVP